MPRLAPQLVRHAAYINKHLPLLLRECRDLKSAKNELRWLTEHVRTSVANASRTGQHANLGTHHFRVREQSLLRGLVLRRSHGEPLQYILGSQPFGDLDILSRPNVLIPRPETESYVLQLAKILRTQCGDRVEGAKPELRIADVCTGTGCIALLLYHELQRQFNVTVTGYDISTHALNLAKENLFHHIKLGILDASASEKVVFQKLDILSVACDIEDMKNDKLLQPVDILVSNPPYISPAQYKPGGTTSASVRKFEPKVALVPSAELSFPEAERADQFYVALLRVTKKLGSKVLVMEVGDNDQALRVVELSRAHFVRGDRRPNIRVEVWKDDGTVIIADGDSGIVKTRMSDMDTDARAVVVWIDRQLVN